MASMMKEELMEEITAITDFLSGDKLGDAYVGEILEGKDLEDCSVALLYKKRKLDCCPIAILDTPSINVR